MEQGKWDNTRRGVAIIGAFVLFVIFFLEMAPKPAPKHKKSKPKPKPEPVVEDAHSDHTPDVRPSSTGVMSSATSAHHALDASNDRHLHDGATSGEPWKRLPQDLREFEDSSEG